MDLGQQIALPGKGIPHRSRGIGRHAFRVGGYFGLHPANTDVAGHGSVGEVHLHIQGRRRFSDQCGVRRVGQEIVLGRQELAVENVLVRENEVADLPSRHLVTVVADAEVGGGRVNRAVRISEVLVQGGKREIDEIASRPGAEDSGEVLGVGVTDARFHVIDKVVVGEFVGGTEPVLRVVLFVGGLGSAHSPGLPAIRCSGTGNEIAQRHGRRHPGSQVGTDHQTAVADSGVVEIAARFGFGIPQVAFESPGTRGPCAVQASQHHVRVGGEEEIEYVREACAGHDTRPDNGAAGRGLYG